jgi:pimeloyl-ACP methyl ester carboxylesterase
MQKIYLFSGLGADRRVFERLTLSGKLVYIDWLTPHPGESLQQYCRRLVEATPIERNQILLGVSFGGIVAGAIAGLIEAKQVLILSSVQHRKQIPILFKIAGYLHLYKFLPYSLLKQPTFLLRLAFSPISNTDYELLKKIVVDTDSTFLQWAIQQVLLWRNETPVANLVHIHGTSDKLFPFRKNANTIAIPDGGHFMIYNRADKISKIIWKKLEDKSV